MTTPPESALPAAGAHPALPSLPFRSAMIAGRKARHFNFVPDAPARSAIAAALDLLDLPALRFHGVLAPIGRSDVELRGDLEATVVQSCIVSFVPVKAHLAEQVLRRYVQDYVEPDADEREIPAEDTESLPDVIDVAAIAIEALALALPLYPRAPGAEFGEASFAAPGTKPLKSEDLKPFAGLAGLAEKLKKPE